MQYLENDYLTLDAEIEFPRKERDGDWDWCKTSQISQKEEQNKDMSLKKNKKTKIERKQRCEWKEGHNMVWQGNKGTKL